MRKNSITRFKVGEYVVFPEDLGITIENKPKTINKGDIARIIKVEITKETYIGFSVSLWLELVATNERFIFSESYSEHIKRIFDEIKTVPASEMSEVLYSNGE